MLKKRLVEINRTDREFFYSQFLFFIHLSWGKKNEMTVNIFLFFS